MSEGEGSGGLFGGLYGMSLSQRGLSIHIGRSVSWIRKQGDLVTTEVIRDGLGWKMKRETWKREKYQSGRLAGYFLAANSEENAA